MSKTVTIPSGDNPFICKINDVYYSYPAGAVVEVPDEVAALIQANAGNREEPTGEKDIAIPRDGEVDDVLTRTAEGAAWKAPSGGGGGVLIVNLDTSTYAFDKTWTEIKNADYPVLVIEANENIKQWMNIASAEYDSGLYNVTALDESNPMIFATDSADGYPVLDTGD